jgi:mannosyltransferase
VQVGVPDAIPEAAQAQVPAPDRRPTPRQQLLERVSPWLVIAVPALTALVVGGYHLGGASLWRDEAYTKTSISRSVSHIFTLTGHMDAVHAAYYLSMHFISGFLGTSAAALRLPSLIAMCIAAACTAAIARRLAVLAAFPVPALTGLLAGMLFATAPYMTRYAQEARSYAIVTMLATIATYLFLRALGSGSWRWWAAYAVAVALTGLFNAFGLLILVAHAVTLLIARTRERGMPAGSARAGSAPADTRIAQAPVRWLVAAVVSVLLLSPLLAVAYHERHQISWLGKPTYSQLTVLFSNFAGSRLLILPIVLIALGAVAADLIVDRAAPLNAAVVALPWLVVPAALLLTVSLVHPVYDERYVEFCLPALSILVAAGIIWLARFVGKTPLAEMGLTWLPSVIVVLGLGGLLIAPQKAIRQTNARPDDLRLASATVAANELPGDIVFYVPFNMRVLGMGYRAPFEKLRDIALGQTPLASGTLNGIEVSPSVLPSRFTHVTRVWVVTGSGTYKFPTPTTSLDKEKMTLISGMHIIHRWMAGQVMLTLYAQSG